MIRSLNVPTVKIIEHTGVDWAAQYARRLGIFSSLNMDFTLALGSSSVTLYEMTRAFGVIGRLGQRLSPVIIRKVLDHEGKDLAKDIGLDNRFKTELGRIEAEFEEKREAALKNPEDKKTPPLYFNDKDQLLRPQTAYVLTTILQGVVDDPNGTAGAARALGRPVAGKTAPPPPFMMPVLMGYTPDIVAGVWVGFDEERSLGRSETGGHAAFANLVRIYESGARRFTTARVSCS